MAATGSPGTRRLRLGTAARRAQRRGAAAGGRQRPQLLARPPLRAGRRAARRRLRPGLADRRDPGRGRRSRRRQRLPSGSRRRPRTPCAPSPSGSAHPSWCPTPWLDARVAALPPVTSGAVGAYLGVPLVVSGGQVVGALCVYDVAAHEWSALDVSTLRAARGRRGRRPRARGAELRLRGAAGRLAAGDRRRRRRCLGVGPALRRAALRRPAARDLRPRPRVLRRHHRGLQRRRPRRGPCPASPRRWTGRSPPAASTPPSTASTCPTAGCAGSLPAAARSATTGRAGGAGAGSGVRHHGRAGRRGPGRAGPGVDAHGVLPARPLVAVRLPQRRGRAAARSHPRGAGR